MKTYEIDGEAFSTLEEFYDELDRVMQLSGWGHNLDAFNDILRGGFGTPEEGFTIRWKKHDLSKRRLGYAETVRQLKFRLEHCHPSNRELVARYLEDAEHGRDQTVFDWLMSIIRNHHLLESVMTKGARLFLIIFFVSSLTAICLSQATQVGVESGLVRVKRVDYLGDAAREPSIVQDPNGTLFVAGYGAGREGDSQKVPRLWTSTDGGAVWKPVNVGGEQAGALANSDVSLAVAPDGTLYYASMEFDIKDGKGTHIVVGVSKDAGRTWHWTTVSKNSFDDRPWVAAAPDGTAHVIWNDGSGVYHVSSRDQGVTWSERQVVNSGGASSFLAVSPKGEVAVRIVPPSASGNKYTEGADLIAISSDGGRTWQKYPAPGKRDWAPADMPGTVPRWVEPLAWDSEGALYSLWTDIKGIWLARSRDRGLTWKQYKVADTDQLVYYPFLTARGSGELAATWFSGASESLRWTVCKIEVEDDRLRIRKSPELETEAWHVPEPANYAPVRSTAGEYLSAIFLKNGEIAVVSPIQDPPAKRFGFTFWVFK